jgi:hypothetical protein
MEVSEMPKDCCKETWEKIPDDEPVFTIRGKDALALKTVEFWIKYAVSSGVNPEKIKQAVECRRDIYNFQMKHSDRAKLPD